MVFNNFIYFLYVYFIYFIYFLYCVIQFKNLIRLNISEFTFIGLILIVSLPLIKNILTYTQY